MTSGRAGEERREGGKGRSREKGEEKGDRGEEGKGAIGKEYRTGGEKRGKEWGAEGERGHFQI